MARPFSRIKLVVRQRFLGQKKPLVQNASYVSAQTCKSGKAGVLTTFIQLPGETSNGRPAPGRTGLCLGSTLVKVSKRITHNHRGKGKGRKRGGREEDEIQQSTGEGETNGSLALRERRHERHNHTTSITDTRLTSQ